MPLWRHRDHRPTATAAAALACLTTLNCAHAQSLWPDGAAVSLRSERFSDPLPLSDLLANRLEGLRPRHDQSLIYLRDEARITAHWATFSLSALARQSATLTANRGAAVLTQDIAASGPPPGDYDAQVQLRLRGFAGWGMELAWQDQWAAAGLQWRVGVQGLQLQRLMTRDVSGQVHHDALSASYAAQLVSDQFNDRHHYPFQGAANAEGWGLLGSLQIRWQASPDWAWHAGIDDWGQLRWNRIAHETATLNTQVALTDSQGNVAYAPLIQGRNSQDDLTQDAIATLRAGLSWSWAPSHAVELNVRKFIGVQPLLPYSGLRMDLSGWQVQTGWLWHERALQLGLGRGPWQLQMAADALDGAAHTRQFQLGWQQRW
jgi:hypothetical protein